MKPNITKIATVIASKHTTTTSARSEFKTLCEQYGKATAKDILSAANEFIKANQDLIKGQNDAARAWLKDYTNVLNTMFAKYCKTPDFKRASKGAKFNGVNGVAFVAKYYPRVTKSGLPVVTKIEYIDGYKFIRYQKANLTRANAFRFLDSATRSLYAVRLGEFKQVIF